MTSPYNLHGLELPSVKPVTFSHGQASSSRPAACRAVLAEVQCDRAQITPVLEKAWLRMEDLSCLTKGVSRLPQGAVPVDSLYQDYVRREPARGEKSWSRHLSRDQPAAPPA